MKKYDITLIRGHTPFSLGIVPNFVSIVISEFKPINELLFPMKSSENLS